MTSGVGGADFSPVPRAARPYQGEGAGLVTRLVANVVDGLTVVVLLVAAYLGYNGLRFVLHPTGFQLSTPSADWVLATLLGVLVLYLAGAWAMTGRTYGDHVMGIRVVDGRGRRVHVPVALLRALTCVAFPIGLLWCAVSRTRRSLQDAVLRTSVVYDWHPATYEALHDLPVHR